jgi:hypothetical protein
MNIGRPWLLRGIYRVSFHLFYTWWPSHPSRWQSNFPFHRFTPPTRWNYQNGENLTFSISYQAENSPIFNSKRHRISGLLTTSRGDLHAGKSHRRGKMTRTQKGNHHFLDLDKNLNLYSQAENSRFVTKEVNIRWVRYFLTTSWCLPTCHTGDKAGGSMTRSWWAKWHCDMRRPLSWSPSC